MEKNYGLMGKIKEARLRFNEKSREYLGDWATRDVHSLAEFSLDVSAIAVGIMGFEKLVGAHDPLAIGCGAFLGSLGALKLKNHIYDNQTEKVRKNPEEYLRLVGIDNAISYTPKNLRGIIQGQLELSSKDFYHL